MVFESVTDRLGGKQAKRVIDLVDDLWDSRKRIVSMVDFVWDNRSQLAGVIDFMGENQDRIADLVGRLPDLVSHAGVGLEAAGSGAQRASLLLSDDEDGPKQLSEAAATALERCQTQLSAVASLLGELGDGLDNVRIPTVQTSRTELMGFSLISGVDIGERPLLDGARQRVSEGATGLAEVAADLGDVATKFRRLGSQLADVGVDLGDAGTELAGSGGTLRSFVGDASKQTTRKPAPKRTPHTKAAAKQSATKKSAAKKTPTKKAATKRKPSTKPTATKTGGKKTGSSNITRRQQAATKQTAKKQTPKKQNTAKKTAAKRSKPKAASTTKRSSGSIIPSSR